MARKGLDLLGYPDTSNRLGLCFLFPLDGHQKYRASKPQVAVKGLLFRRNM